MNMRFLVTLIVAVSQLVIGDDVLSKNAKQPYDVSKLSLDDRSRINCFLEAESVYENLTRYQCEEVRGCIYSPSQYERIPDCYFKRKQLGYEWTFTRVNKPNREVHHLKRSQLAKAPYLYPIENLALTVEYMENNVIHVKIEDNDDPDRYQVPYKLNDFDLVEDKEESKARFEHWSDPDTNLFYFRIVRIEDNETIFDTSNGAFVYEDQFIQISTKLNTPYIYGFGENNHDTLLHDLNYTSWGMFTRDYAPGWSPNKNMYGVQPVYYSIENSGKSHLVLLHNSNAMEYLFNPSPSLTLRTIGGILDFYFIVDDQPETIFQTYQNLIGKPFLPPYWSFGFQISRWGYNNLTEVKGIVDRTRAIGMFQDVQYVDIEYMIGFRILTVDQINFKGLRDYQKQMKNMGLHLVLISDAEVVMETNNSYYMTGISKKNGGIFVKWPEHMAPYDKDNLNRDDMVAWCWPNGKAVYPDFMNEETHKWWEETLLDFTTNENGTDIDGLWLDMNEPSAFETNEIRPFNWLNPENDLDRYPYFSLKCPTNQYDDPPYRTKNAFAFDASDVLLKKARLSQKTLCMVAQHKRDGKKYLHYNVHSLYGHSMTMASHAALTNIKKTKRPFILTRSNYVGTGHYAAHWLGDNEAIWKHMRTAIIGLIEFNIFGITMIGSDICGFFGPAYDAEMCTRWLQVGAFYPFSRNHNSKGAPDRDPAAYNNRTLEQSTRNVYKIRYTLLPYLYTLIYRTHRYGGTSVKALFFEFPTDRQTYTIQEQFLLGPNLLISPVLYPGNTTVNAYFPDATWYDFRTGVEQTKTKQWVVLDAPLDYINVHVRGGSILPTQDPVSCLNTQCSRNNPMGLIISLDKNQSAKGSLYWDDGESQIDHDATRSNYYYAEFNFERNVLTMDVQNSYADMSKALLNDITINGLKTAVSRINVNDVKLDTGKYEFNQQTKVLKIKQLNLNIDNENKFKVEIIN